MAGAAIQQNPLGTKIALPLRRKILYYALLLGLTLLAIEGMARLAYYAAYSQWYGGGGLAVPVNSIPPAAPEYFAPRRIPHPFYGATRGSPAHPLNAMPPSQRREDTVVIALLGSSVAELVAPFLQDELHRRFAAAELPRRPVVLNLAIAGAKQPRQTMVVANTLLLGGEFDLIVNLDGFNELGDGVWSAQPGLFPFFPQPWGERQNMTGAEFLLAGQLRALRGEQGRRAAAGATSPLRWSALFGLVNRYRQESAAAEIIRLNHELATPPAAYRRPPPESQRNPDPQRRRQRLVKTLPENARVWYRSSLALARLAAVAGADYYHFLQPNQYVPDSKPLSPQELAAAYDPASPRRDRIELGYPLLQDLGQELPRAGVNSFDLTGIFAGHTETLYNDTCCHVNDRGNELLAAAIVQRLEPALLPLGQESPAASLSPLAAARRPPAAPEKPLPPPPINSSLLRAPL